MGKKKNPPKKPEATIKRRQVGKRISRREVIVTTIPYPDSVARLIDISKPGSSEENISHLERKYIAPLEEWANAVIKAEGQPEDPEEEYVSRRWYATEILREIRFIRTAIQRNNCENAALFSFRLGRIEQEFYDLDILDEESRKGFRGRKPDPVIMRFVISRFRKDPKVKGKDLIEELKKRDAYKSIRIGKAKLFMEGDSIKVYEKGDERLIRKNSIYRYLKKMKDKRLAR